MFDFLKKRGPVQYEDLDIYIDDSDDSKETAHEETAAGFAATGAARAATQRAPRNLLSPQNILETGSYMTMAKPKYRQKRHCFKMV